MYNFTPQIYSRLLGPSSLSGTASNLSNGYNCVNTFVAAASGTIHQFQIKMVASDNILLGVYADSAGLPGSRLYRLASVAVVAGLNIINLPDAGVAVTSGTSYWISVESQNGLNIIIVGSADTLRYKANTYSNGVAPDPYGTADGTLAETMQVQAWGN